MIRTVFLGDSITAFWEVHRPALFAGHGFVNRGIPGETSRQIKLRLRAAIDETRAERLHLLCGFNDIVGNEGPVETDAIQRNFAEMLAAARALGVRTWVGSIMPSDGAFWVPHLDPKPRIAAMNRWLQGYAPGVGAIYVDYHRVLASPTGGLRADYSEDGVHLSPAGYEAIEATLLAHCPPPVWGR